VSTRVRWLAQGRPSAGRRLRGFGRLAAGRMFPGAYAARKACAETPARGGNHPRSGAAGARTRFLDAEVLAARATLIGYPSLVSGRLLESQLVVAGTAGGALPYQTQFRRTRGGCACARRSALQNPPATGGFRRIGAAVVDTRALISPRPGRGHESCSWNPGASAYPPVARVLGDVGTGGQQRRDPRWALKTKSAPGNLVLWSAADYRSADWDGGWPRAKPDARLELDVGTSCGQDRSTSVRRPSDAVARNRPT